MKFEQHIFLVGGGDVDRERFMSVYDGSPCVGVDGGGNFFEAALRKESFTTDEDGSRSGRIITPAAIIGDLDSLKNRSEWEGKCQVIEIADQNSTDLEKALTNIDAPFYLGFGFLDSRFDHTLEVLHLIQKYPEKQCVFFSSKDIIFAIPAEWKITLPARTRLSLYPLAKTNILSGTGWKYDPSGLKMEQGKRIGTSNETIGNLSSHDDTATSNISETTLTHDNHNMLLGIAPIEHYKAILSSISSTILFK